MTTAIRQSEKSYLAVCAEYLDLPGLILTLDQAARLFHMDRAACAHVLAELVAAGFLRDVGGRYARADAGFDMEQARWSDLAGIEAAARPGGRHAPTPSATASTRIRIGRELAVQGGTHRAQKA